MGNSSLSSASFCATEAGLSAKHTRSCGLNRAKRGCKLGSKRRTSWSNSHASSSLLPTSLSIDHHTLIQNLSTNFESNLEPAVILLFSQATALDCNFQEVWMLCGQVCACRAVHFGIILPPLASQSQTQRPQGKASPGRLKHTA